MYDMEDCFSISLLFAAIVVNAYSFWWIGNLKKEIENKENLLIIGGFLLLNSSYLFVVHFVWPDVPFLNYGGPFPLIYGPLLWCASMMISRSKFKITNHLFHFLPFLLFLIAYLYLVLFPGNKMLLKTHIIILFIFTAIQMLFYLIPAVQNFKNANDKNRGGYALRLQYFNYVSILLGVVLLLFFFNAMENIIHRSLDEYLPSSYIIYFFLLGLSFIFQWGIILHWRKAKEYQKILSIWESSIIKKSIPTTSANTKMNKDSKKYIHLESLATKIEKLPAYIFQDQDLNLQKLSKILNNPDYIITETLNQVMGINFNQYINNKRLEIAKQLLEENDKSLSISTVAFRSGFNSDTSFYRIFKKVYHQTPRQYQQAYRDKDKIK